MSKSIWNRITRAYLQYLEDGVTDYTLLVKEEAELARINIRKSVRDRAMRKLNV